MKKHILFVASILLLLSACKQKDNQLVPEKKDLSDYQQTQFVPTLESDIEPGKNSIYCSTLLLAWDSIRTICNGDLRVLAKDTDLSVFNASRSYINSLSKYEYKSSVEIEGQKLKLRVELKKDLPFEEPLKDMGELKFGQSKVESFGIDEADSQVEILYYAGENDFVIRIKTKYGLNELILLKTGSTFKNLSQAVDSTRSKIRRGKLEIQSKKFPQYYSFNLNDTLMIPKISFNIESTYPDMEGKEVYSRNQKMELKKMYQRTAFVLNEKGALIESDAEIKVLGNCIDRCDFQPKKMIFDKPYFIMIRKYDSKDPYFAMWVENAEIMIIK